GRFKSIMPRALKGVIDEHIQLDSELSEDDNSINNVHAFLTDNLIDTLWDTIGDMIGDISKEAKMEFNLGDYRAAPEDKEFNERETEYRERDNEGL
ncbi:MAG: hypothetical protein ABGY11_02640, partial [Candidatus Thioglobus sp.]